MNSKLYLSAFLVACFFTCSHGQIDRTDCVVHYAIPGNTNFCLEGRVAVGACGSDNLQQCNSSNRYQTGLTCCLANNNPCGADTKDCVKVPAFTGVEAVCPAGQVVVANCGSDGSAYCYSDDIAYHAMITCCETSVVPSTNCQWACASSGQHIECPADYVQTGWCGSGSVTGCNNGNDSHCIYCCEIDAQEQF